MNFPAESSAAEVIAAIQASQYPLIITHENADGDAVGSAFGLFLFFNRLEKQPTVVIDRAVPETFTFLPGTDKATFDNFFPREMIIRLDCQDATIDSLRWTHNKVQNSINIIITPKSGYLDSSKASFSEGGSSFDAIFILDTAAVSRIDKIYSKNRDLFEKLLTINIDHHADNPLFGKINLIDPSKSSVAEILAGVFKEIDEKLIDADIATCLLAGIIADTGSFQFSCATSNTLKVASELINHGGRRDEIIKHIYNTRRLSTLRLWGRILSKMQIDLEARLVWSTISQDDLIWAEADIDERKGLINELMTHVTEADMVLLLTDDGQGVRGSIRTKNGNNRAREMAATFGGGGHELAAGFYLPDRDLTSAEREVVARAREIQKASVVSMPIQKKVEEENREGEISLTTEMSATGTISGAPFEINSQSASEPIKPFPGASSKPAIESAKSSSTPETRTESAVKPISESRSIPESLMESAMESVIQSEAVTRSAIDLADETVIQPEISAPDEVVTKPTFESIGTEGVDDAVLARLQQLRK